jgi:hypothetical protein
MTAIITKSDGSKVSTHVFNLSGQWASTSFGTFRKSGEQWRWIVDSNVVLEFEPQIK